MRGNEKRFLTYMCFQSIPGRAALTGAVVLLSACSSVQNTAPGYEANADSGPSKFSGPMIAIPPGNFVMGDDRSSQPDERPAHRVHVDAFLLSAYEVTLGQFRLFLAATGYQNHLPCWGWEGQRLAFQEEWSWLDPGFPQSDNHPVACISWQDAQAYVQWINIQLKPKKPFRLPSEAEWEYAVRVGRYDRFPWGDEVDGTKLNCWSCRDPYEYTSPVGSFAANPYGLFDMSGNQWEWVEDCYSDNYNNAPAVAAATRAPECRSHVLRGGSWADNDNFLRAAYRVPYQNGYRQQSFGFRLAQDAP